MGVTRRSAISAAGAIFSRWRPGSPWMPMPISISPSGRSKEGLPLAGTVQEVRAMPMERPAALTRAAMASTSSSGRPSSAAAPAIFSTMTVTPTPRRPAV